MPQTRESGNRARSFGYRMAEQVANILGAILTNPGRSNEAMWNNRRILIKSAHHGVPEIGATVATLGRVDAIIAALQDQDGDYTLYELVPGWFQSVMKPSRSPRAPHVMMVSCGKVREAGKMVGRVEGVL